MTFHGYILKRLCHVLPFSPMFATKFLYADWQKDYTLHCDVVELGGMNAMPTRAADRPRLYYNIFLNFDGSVLAYLVAPEEEEKRGLK